jgi:hypothetical protein
VIDKIAQVSDYDGVQRERHGSTVRSMAGHVAG